MKNDCLEVAYIPGGLSPTEASELVELGDKLLDSPAIEQLEQDFQGCCIMTKKYPKSDLSLTLLQLRLRTLDLGGGNDSQETT